MAKKSAAQQVVENRAPAEEKAKAKPKAKMKNEPIVDAIQFDDMVAKAAYFNAEKRGFAPGNEMQDWLQAEQQIAASLNRR